jgi:hypothetical protein
MERRASDQRRRYWRDVVARQRRSGLSVAAFCRQQQVSPAAFYDWKRRLAGEMTARSTEVSFVPLPLDQAVPPRAAEFSLRLPNGVEVTVPGNFDEAALKRLLPLAGAVERGDA